MPFTSALSHRPSVCCSHEIAPHPHKTHGGVKPAINKDQGQDPPPWGPGGLQRTWEPGWEGVMPGCCGVRDPQACMGVRFPAA